MEGARFCIETYGCSANISESEIMAGLLSSAGLMPVSDIENADLVIVNTCFVKQTTENKILSRINKISREFPKKALIIAGCIPEAAPEKLAKMAPKASLLSTHRIDEIEKVARKALLGKRIKCLGRRGAEKVNLPKIRENPITDIVEICSGCLGNCSYCGTKLAKGNLISYLPEKICSEIRQAKSQGVKEFWLTGQDISCYGFDIETNLPELLEKVLETKGKYFVRLGMLNPAHLKKILNPLLEVCSNERVYKFFHIPVQSGSDIVLSAMNRKYSVSDFTEIVEKIRSKSDKVTIGTDIIVGYPTETEADFKETLKLLGATKPDWTNISKYSSRSGTAAAKLKPLDSAIVKERSEIASNLARKIAAEQTKKWNGWSGKVLVYKKGLGRNFGYRTIEVESQEVGKFINAEVEKIKGVKIFGKVL